MLYVKVSGGEFYSESRGEFVTIEDEVLTMEHSLLSVSKWESKWKQPFLTNKEKTLAQWQDYFHCMTIGKPKSILIFAYIQPGTHAWDKILEYINDSMTATTFSNRGESRKPKGGRHETLTSELIYYYMASAGVPFECEKWHISRLLVLLRIAAIKSAPDKKMSKKDIAKQNRALNAARRGGRPG